MYKYVTVIRKIKALDSRLKSSKKSLVKKNRAFVKTFGELNIHSRRNAALRLLTFENFQGAK